jgi:protein-disulfide isomerase
LPNWNILMMPLPAFPRIAAAVGFVMAGLLLADSSAHAQSSPAPSTSLSAEQRKAVIDLIRETLLKNPEIIQEALVEIESRNQVAQAQAQKNAVAAEKTVLFENPRSPVAGNPQGDVTIVEFFDYNCGYCKRALDDMRALIKEDSKIKVVLKDFPVLGPESVEASRVAVAVKNQLQGEKYWDFHIKLMATKGRINGAKAIEVAREAGANIEQLRKDIDSPETRKAIDDTVALGDRLSLTGTPAFIVADEVVFGAVGNDALKARIAAVRKCGKTNCG